MKPKRRQLITANEAQTAKGQHKRPCSDCPWARGALPGWLGDMTAQEWVDAAHGEASAECHTLLGADCAGLAIYRANVAKSPRDPSALRLPADRVAVFASPAEFCQHHARAALPSSSVDQWRGLPFVARDDYNDED
jgi:hypothetical protein